jgi:hypothetical protein
MLVPAALSLLTACGGGVQAKVNTGESSESASSNEAGGGGGGGNASPQFKFNRKKPWMQPPGPIAGKWKTTAQPPDMVIEITTNGSKAVGRIVTLGDGGKRHYSVGEEILNLEVNDYGHWVGQLHWKSLAGGDRKEYIRFVATPDELDAIMTTDAAFKHMPKVR